MIGNRCGGENTGLKDGEILELIWVDDDDSSTMGASVAIYMLTNH